MVAEGIADSSRGLLQERHMPERQISSRIGVFCPVTGADPSKFSFRLKTGVTEWEYL